MVLIYFILLFIILNILIWKKKYHNKKMRTNNYYQSVWCGIGNKLMAVANLLILSKINNRNAYCIISNNY